MFLRALLALVVPVAWLVDLPSALKTNAKPVEADWSQNKMVKVMRALFTAVLFFALSPALADDTVPHPPVAIIPATAPLPDGVTPPKASGERHLCPLKPVRAVAIVEFTIAADGHVRDVQLLRSTGYRDLNALVTDCVSKWTYTPAMKDGKPVDVRWMTSMIFRVTDGPPFKSPPPPPADGTQTKCDAQTPKTGTPIKLIVDLRQDGSIKQINVLKPSGDGAFDDYATNCVAAWRYQAPRSTGSVDYQYVTLPAKS